MRMRSSTNDFTMKNRHCQGDKNLWNLSIFVLIVSKQNTILPLSYWSIVRRRASMSATSMQWWPKASALRMLYPAIADGYWQRPDGRRNLYGLECVAGSMDAADGGEDWILSPSSPAVHDWHRKVESWGSSRIQIFCTGLQYCRTSSQKVDSRDQNRTQS